MNKEQQTGKLTRADAIPTLKRRVQELCEEHGHLIILDHVRAALAIRLSKPRSKGSKPYTL